MATPHDWIEILNRRWCLTCALFQARKDSRYEWQPVAEVDCPQTYRKPKLKDEEQTPPIAAT